MRGYYRLPKKKPANRVDGELAEIVRRRFAEGWPKTRIAREFRMHRHTVARICSENELPN
jgi:DNA invertase Pin-like site-specific DNA recombinase